MGKRSLKHLVLFERLIMSEKTKNNILEFLIAISIIGIVWAWLYASQ